MSPLLPSYRWVRSTCNTEPLPSRLVYGEVHRGQLVVYTVYLEHGLRYSAPLRELFSKRNFIHTATQIYDHVERSKQLSRLILQSFVQYLSQRLLYVRFVALPIRPQLIRPPVIPEAGV